MKYLLTLFVAVVVSIFSVSSFALTNEEMDSSARMLSSELGSAVDGLKKTSQAYLDSGDFEEAEEALARKYATARTDRERKALARAYGEILKLKEFAEAWATPLEDVATITKTEENGVITYHFDFHKNKK